MKRAILLLVTFIFLYNTSYTQVADRWTPLDDLKSFLNFIIDPVDTNIIYASYSNGICKSNNGGISWTDINIFTSDHTGEIVQNPLYRDTLYIGVEAIGPGGRGIYRSSNRGNTWPPQQHLIVDTSVSCIVINPIKPWILYAGTITNTYTGSTVGILRSNDAGASWSLVNNGLGNLDINQLVINPLDTGTLFAATENGLYKTHDGGQNWQSSGSGLPGGSVINHIAINPADTNIVFAGTQGDGIYKSTDGGNSWSASNTGLSNWIIHWIAIHPVSPERIYVSVDDGGVFRSLDSGSTWEQMDQTGIGYVYKTHTIRLNPLNPDIIYALFGYGTTGTQIYKRLEDFTPPAIPSNLKGIPGDREVTISWKPNTEPDLDKYDIYRDSVFLTSINGTGPGDTVYTDTSLVNEKFYRYMLTAVDKKGNESGYSEELLIRPYLNPTGLVAYYSLDGNAIDNSGHGNDGGAIDCSPAENRYNDPNACFEFNGTSSYINCANYPMTAMPDQVTLMAWIYPRSVADTGYIVSKSLYTLNTGNYNLRLIPGKKLEFAYKDGSGEDVAFQSVDTIPLNKWTHIAFTYDFKNHEIGFYLNTIPAIGSWNASGPPQEGEPALEGHDLCIGSTYIRGIDWEQPVKLFDGYIDEVYLYNIVLDLSEIKPIADMGPKTPANLKSVQCNTDITLTFESYDTLNTRLFRIYRDDQSPAVTFYDTLSVSGIVDTLYLDHTAYGETWYYRVTAVDSSGFESNFSNEVMALTEKAVDLGPDTSICTNEFLQIDAGAGFLSYEWSVVGETGQYLDITETDEYWVKVTSNDGSCTSYDTISIVVHGVPEVDLGPDRWICSGSNLVLQAPAGFDGYLWSNGANTASVIITEPGDYNVTVTSGGICDGFDEVTVSLLETYQDQKICLVTVDPATDKLMVIWEKPVGKGIEYFKIYREGDMIGDYQLKATIPYYDLSIFYDVESQPGNQQYLYKISIVDSCGNESDPSPYHKTLLLQFTGSVGGVNLGWSEYEVEDGFISFGSYDIFRGSTATDLGHIKTLSASLDRYIDSDPDALTALYYYRIAGVLIEPCYPSGTTKADPEPYTRSMSNIEDNKFKTFISDPEPETAFTVYPNPFSSGATITFPNPDNHEYKMVLTDISGRIVRKSGNILSGNFLLDRKDLPAGIYIIELKGEKVYRSEIVIE